VVGEGEPVRAGGDSGATDDAGVPSPASYIERPPSELDHAAGLGTSLPSLEPVPSANSCSSSLRSSLPAPRSCIDPSDGLKLLRFERAELSPRPAAADVVLRLERARTRKSAWSSAMTLTSSPASSTSTCAAQVVP